MDFRRYLAFGAGAGIEIRQGDLEITVTRVRPSGIEVLGRSSIRRFRERPAAEWGSEYSAFLNRCGAAYLSATVLLPRHEVIVRHLALPGVAGKDLNAAIQFQLDTLHPYGEDEVAWGWSPLSGGNILIGITRKDTLDRYLELFSEAGVAVASFTFSAAAIHAALRIYRSGDRGEFLAMIPGTDGVETYGESAARPVFSAAFDMPAPRAGALAASELRLPPEIAPAPLERLLPAPKQNPVENDLGRDPLPYATALAGACPRISPAANLLPPERRATNSRAMYIPTAILGGLVLLFAGALAAHSTYEDRRYLKKLDAEIARIEPVARRAAALDRQLDQVLARTRVLDEFRRRARTDLEALNEMTKLLAPPVWTSNIELTHDAAIVNGEAEAAAPLLKVLDDSPLFEKSEFTLLSKVGSNEVFRIHSDREARK